MQKRCLVLDYRGSRTQCVFENAFALASIGCSIQLTLSSPRGFCVVLGPEVKQNDGSSRVTLWIAALRTHESAAVFFDGSLITEISTSMVMSHPLAHPLSDNLNSPVTLVSRPCKNQNCAFVVNMDSTISPASAPGFVLACRLAYDVCLVEKSSSLACVFRSQTHPDGQRYLERLSLASPERTGIKKLQPALPYMTLLTPGASEDSLLVEHSGGSILLGDDSVARLWLTVSWDDFQEGNQVSFQPCNKANCEAPKWTVNSDGTLSPRGHENTLAVGFSVFAHYRSTSCTVASEQWQPIVNEQARRYIEDHAEVEVLVRAHSRIAAYLEQYSVASWKVVSKKIGVILAKVEHICGISHYQRRRQRGDSSSSTSRYFSERQFIPSCRLAPHATTKADDILIYKEPTAPHKSTLIFLHSCYGRPQHVDAFLADVEEYATMEQHLRIIAPYAPKRCSNGLHEAQWFEYCSDELPQGADQDAIIISQLAEQRHRLLSLLCEELQKLPSDGFLVLGGMSQGASMVADMLLHCGLADGRLVGAFFSRGIVQQESVSDLADANANGGIRGWSLLATHGYEDCIIPIRAARQSYCLLEERGAQLRFLSFPGMAHEDSNQDESRALASFFTACGIAVMKIRSGTCSWMFFYIALHSLLHDLMGLA